MSTRRASSLLDVGMAHHNGAPSIPAPCMATASPAVAGAAPPLAGCSVAGDRRGATHVLETELAQPASLPLSPPGRLPPPEQLPPHNLPQQLPPQRLPPPTCSTPAKLNSSMESRDSRNSRSSEGDGEIGDCGEQPIKRAAGSRALTAVLRRGAVERRRDAERLKELAEQKAAAEAKAAEAEAALQAALAAAKGGKVVSAHDSHDAKSQPTLAACATVEPNLDSCEGDLLGADAGVVFGIGGIHSVAQPAGSPGVGVQVAPLAPSAARPSSSDRLHDVLRLLPGNSNVLTVVARIEGSSSRRSGASPEQYSDDSARARDSAQASACPSAGRHSSSDADPWDV